MKELMKQYGRFIFAGSALMVIFLLVFSGVRDSEGNQGILAIFAAHMNTEGIEYGNYNDYDTYHTEGMKAAPEITYQDIGHLPVGTVSFLDQVTVADHAGRALGYAGSTVDDTERSLGYFKIVKFQDAAGNDLSSNINVDTGEINFPEPGVYEVTLRAQDDGCRNSIVAIRVAVM